MLILKLAFRNLFRNKKRTILSIIAIGIGVCALMVADATIKGMNKNMINSAVQTLTGHAQIHNKDFLTSFEVDKTIKDNKEILNEINSNQLIKHHTKRTLSLGMVSSSVNSESIMVYGIDVKNEINLSVIDNHIKEGNYLSEKSQNGILIGKKLAKSLDVKLGDKIILTLNKLTETKDESPLSQGMFRIEGIYSTGIDEIDKFGALIKIDEAQNLLNIGDNVHEIAILFNNINNSTDNTIDTLNIKTPNEIKNWQELFPELKSMLKMTQFMIFIMAFILFSIVSIGIVNTLFMSIYERMFEFGVMKSIGTKPSQMFKLIISEAILLTLLSIVFGYIIGTALNFYLSINGLNYKGVSVMDVTITSNVFPIISYTQYVYYPALLLIISTLVALYPATYTAKLDPTVIMKK